jgi:hypothetical protein
MKGSRSGGAGAELPGRPSAVGDLSLEPFLQPHLLSPTTIYSSFLPAKPNLTILLLNHVSLNDADQPFKSMLLSEK